MDRSFPHKDTRIVILETHEQVGKPNQESSGSRPYCQNFYALPSTDTDMMAGTDVEKNDPADVVRAALDGIEAGKPEIIAYDQSTQVKAALYPRVISCPR